MQIKLTSEQLGQFARALKTGIYRELYQKDLLTADQLASLLNRI